jgi:hypothetical protein
MPWKRLGERYSSYSFSTSALDGGWVVSVTPRPRFSPGKKTPVTHYTGGWVGPTASPDTKAREKSFCLCQGSNLDRQVVQPVARHYTGWATRLTTTQTAVHDSTITFANMVLSLLHSIIVLHFETSWTTVKFQEYCVSCMQATSFVSVCHFDVPKH